MATVTAPEPTRSSTPPSASAPGRGEPIDTTIRLVTPERVRFEYPLAGPFRRSVAYLIDLMVVGLIATVGNIALAFLTLGNVAGLGLYLAFLFILWWGYGALFEGLGNGQTPGKRVMGIRVVSDDGVPITGTQAFLRNLLWSIDGMLLGYIPAVACMVLTRRFQRLGDLAAGTMVVVEHQPGRGGLLKIAESEVRDVVAWLPSRVEAGPELARALADYVKARRRFSSARREEMAERLARPLRHRYQLPADSKADAVLCAFYQRVFLSD